MAVTEARAHGTRSRRRAPLLVCGTRGICSMRCYAIAAPLHVWEKVEITLNASNACANPYTDVQVWVTQRPRFGAVVWVLGRREHVPRARAGDQRRGVGNGRSGSRPQIRV